LAGHHPKVDIGQPQRTQGAVERASLRGTGRVTVKTLIRQCPCEDFPQKTLLQAAPILMVPKWPYLGEPRLEALCHFRLRCAARTEAREVCSSEGRKDVMRRGEQPMGRGSGLRAEKRCILWLYRLLGRAGIMGNNIAELWPDLILKGCNLPP
jgi:hypothetical protein